MAYADNYETAASARFQQRVLMAVLKAAVAISSEATSTPDDANRKAYSKQALNNPQVVTVPWAQAMAAQGYSNTSADTDLDNGVSSIWNGFSG